METASAGRTYDMVIDEDPFYNSLSYSVDDHDLKFNTFHSESLSSCPYKQPPNNFHVPSEIPAYSSPGERPAKQLRHHVSTPTHKPPHSYPQIISFRKTSSSSSSASLDYETVMAKDEEITWNDFSYLATQGEMIHHGQLYDAQGTSYNKSNSTRTHLRAREHLLAERKRRERLNQRFIALSAIIPSLKKMDRAAILEGAIKYLRQLQERVKTLEEEVSKKTLESVVLVKRSRLPTDDDTTSSVENSYNQPNQQNFPEIKAQVSGKSVLIRVHCENRQGCVSKIVDEIEKLNLVVINSSVLPFGSCILDITIMARMEVEFDIKSEDFIRNLQRVLLPMI